jgi:hypothetical protein
LRHGFIALQWLVIAVAASLALLPLPHDTVERYYSDWLYPALQADLTSWSNLSRQSLFDVLVAALGLGFLIGWARVVASARRERRVMPIVRGLWRSVIFAAAIYAWFALAWGLNYSRAPIEQSIDYKAERITPAALRALAGRATTEVNRLYAVAHQTGFPELGQVPPTLVASLHTVERGLGRPRPTIPGRPKRTWLWHFFRATGVDGMHAPFLAETLLNADLTPPERPAVLAHEWAHLAGYAPEADASFVGLLAALRADPASQYSAWLALFDQSVGQLPRSEQREFVARLEPGPRADRQAISQRLEARVDVLARASWETYDHYLKAQGVDEGIESYSRVVQLLLAAGAVDLR